MKSKFILLSVLLTVFIGLPGCHKQPAPQESSLERLIDVSARAPFWDWSNPVKPLSSIDVEHRHVFQVELQSVNRNALVLFRNETFAYTFENPGNGRLEFWAAGIAVSEKNGANNLMVGVSLRSENGETHELFPLDVSSSADQPWKQYEIHLLDMSGPVECEFRLVLSLDDEGRNDLYAVVGSPVFIPRSIESLPNVVIVCLDSLRADELGSYGSPLANSPTMDMLARNGVVFSDTLSSSSWTVPGVKNLLAGNYSWLDQAETDQIPELSGNTDPMIQDIFADAGYYTAAVMGNPLITPNLGFERGFDMFDMYPVRSWYDGSAQDTYMRIARTIEQHHDRPLFLYIHAMDPHDPYAPSYPYDQMNNPPPDNLVRPFIRQRVSGYLNLEPHKSELLPLTEIEDHYLRRYYRGSIREMDSILHLVLSTLRMHTDFPENTIVIVTSDHGEEFAEHGYYQHGMSLYESSVRVPWIMTYPGMVSEDRIIDGRVSTIDIPATLSGLVFGQTSRSWEGISVYPEPATPLRSRTLFTAVRSVDEPSIPRTRWRAVYRGNRKLMWSPSVVRGYDLVRYPDEKPLFEYGDLETFTSEIPDTNWREMTDDLQEFMSRFAVHKVPEMSEVLTMQLRELGYIQ